VIKWSAVAVALFLGMFTLTAPAYPPAAPELEYSELPLTISTNVLEGLALSWQAYEGVRLAPEQVWCVTRYEVIAESDSTPRVLIKQVTPALMHAATPFSALFECGVYPALHTHPPYRCRLELGSLLLGCTVETDYACEPSYTDLTTTYDTWHRWGAVQCGRDRFIAFMVEQAGG
jgi:hypothetical protein